MQHSLMTASVTMGQLQNKLNTITNNLANSNTAGFKSREARFSDLLVQQINNQPVPAQEEGRLTLNGIRRGSGARVSQTTLNLEKGALKTTDRELDFALPNDYQFFTIQAERGGQIQTEYTRKGAFYLQNVGNTGVMRLVTSEGFPVQGTTGDMFIPRDFKSMDLQEDGSLLVTRLDGTTVNAGTLNVVEITRPQVLRSVGDQNFALPNVPGLQQGAIVVPINAAAAGIQQKVLEQSNVNMTKEISELMSTQRAYQFSARALTMTDQMSGLINQLR